MKQYKLYIYRYRYVLKLSLGSSEEWILAKITTKDIRLTLEDDHLRDQVKIKF